MPIARPTLAAATLRVLKRSVVVLAGAVLLLAAAPALSLTLVAAPPNDQPLSFTWRVTWDRSFANASVNTDNLVPKPKYWVATVSILDRDGDGTSDDLVITMRHWRTGPELPIADGGEGLPHDDSKPYQYALDNALAALPVTGNGFKNVLPSIELVPHSAKGGEHRDEDKLQYQRVDAGSAIVFELQGRHDALPVPEPSTAALAAAGLAAIAVLALRRRRG